MRMTSDVTEGASILRVHGNREAWLENYQSLLEYTDTRIRVAGKHMEVCVDGTDMRIEYYGSIDMKIVGNIRTIEFV